MPAQPSDLFDRMFTRIGEDRYSRIGVHELPSWLFAYAVGVVTMDQMLSEFKLQGVAAHQVRQLASTIASLSTDDEKSTWASKFEWYCRIEEQLPEELRSRKRFKARVGIV